MDNPYYVSVDIPNSEEEKAIAASNLLKAASDILDAADVCTSGTVLNLDLAQRSELEDANVHSDEPSHENEVRLNSVLISQVHTVKDPIQLALKALQEKLTVVEEFEIEGVDGRSEKSKHYIKVHNKLVSDYSHNPELMSGAFPCLFPLGITAKDVGTTGPLTNIQTSTLFLNKDRRFANNRQFLL